MEEFEPLSARKRSRKAAAGWTLIFSYSQVAYAIIGGIFLVPLYLRFIPLELYGAWLATGNILSWLTVVDPGISTVIMQRVGRAYGSEALPDLVGYVKAGAILTGGITLIFLLFGVFVAGWVPAWIGFADNPMAKDLSHAFLLAVVGTSFTFFSYAFSAASLGILGSVGPGMVTLISNFGSLLLTTVLLFAGYGVFAIAWALVFRGVFTSLGYAGYLYYRLRGEQIELRGSTPKLKEMLGLLSFTSLSRLGGVFARHMDAFLLARFLGPEIVPVFVLTRRGMNIFEVLLIRPANAMSASLSHLSGEAAREKVCTVVLRILRLNIWLLTLAGAGFLIFNESFIRLWVGADLYAGATVSAILCVVMVGRVLFSTMNVICQALGDIKNTSLAVFAHSLTTILCLFIGVKYFGLIGAAAAPLIGYSLIYIWYFPRAMRRVAGLTSADGLALVKEAGLVVAVASVVGLLFAAVSPQSWNSFGAFVIVFAAVFAVSLIFLSKSARSELHCFKGAILSRLGPRLPRNVL